MKQVPVLMLALIAAALPSVAQSPMTVKEKLAEGVAALVPGSRKLALPLNNEAKPQAAAANVPTLQFSSGVSPAVLHTFNVPSSSVDGQGPDAPVIFASDGKLYSTTTAGGKNGCGTIFNFDPATQIYLTLYSLDCENDGTLPLSGLIQATDGYLYGTTIAFGAPGSEVAGGALFRYNISSGAFTSLYRFQHGGTPYGDMIDDGKGTLYGTTFSDGNFGDGSVWSWNYQKNSFKTLYSFTGEQDGAGVTGGLVLASDGMLYGTAAYGGTFGWGTAFELNTNGTGFKAFYNFTNFYSAADGSLPSADLVEAQDGNLYGTSCCGGALSLQGAFFRITPSGAASTLTPLAVLGQSVYPNEFAEGGDVDLGRPMIAGDGYMYLTPGYGGTNPGGTALQMDTFGNANRIYTFENPYDDFAINPYGGVVEGQDGNLYGATYSSGFASGILYELNTGLPPAISLTASTSSAYVGVPLSLAWSANNAFSNNAAVCLARSTDGTFGGNGSAGLRALSGEESITPVGSGSVTYSFTCGGVESATATVQVSKVPTTTTIESAPTTIQQGQTAKVSVVVAAHVGSNVPEGSVSLVVGSQTVSTAMLSNGKATFSFPTTLIAPGVYQLHVTYGGSTAFVNSVSVNDKLDIKVLPAISFHASPTTTTQGLDSIFSVLLGKTGAPSPTGTVTFSTPAYKFGSTTISSGVATFVANFGKIPAGTYVVTAAYSGDNYNEAVSATQTVKITKATTTTSLTGSTTINAGSSGSYKVSVARPNVPGTATGKVTLMFGTASVGSAELSGGIASITVPSSVLKAATYEVTAQYAGDANNNPSSSQALAINVR
ncbi:Ig-like domain-containing protein [Granulicella sp. S190]|uniref:Ig-like domain-containing protein n=1 Tax=Granulicella sp. S190 TaxID=1747226 RepID=UPI00131ABEF0|nr:Ig-like domain-containing protein [Granulicella sp. S190]